MPPPQTISVTDLDIAQLADELNHLTNSFAQLKQAQAKFKTCIKNVRGLRLDKTIPGPLTNSLYVPGKLCDVDYVMVDVGTGYYVRKTRKQAIKHYTDKVGYIQTNIDSLEETIQKKRENMNYLITVIQV
ncbi:Prefoldin alpha-like protein [Amanita rubescens]|nr:Prefoldin alpha-like protein [Amanita rubescens]